MKSFFFCFFLIVTLLLSCQKPDDNNRPTPPTASVDTAKTILFDTRDEEANGKVYVTLTAFSANGTMKWKRTQLGTTSSPSLAYSNGVIYVSVGYFEFINGGPGIISYRNLYAINADNGNNIWANTNSTDYIYSMVPRNDTLFCSISTGNSNFIGAYNSTNGALLWKKQIPFPYPALGLKLDGGTLFFGTASSTTVNNIIAFDIPSRTIIWDTPIGINFVNAFSNLVVYGNSIFLKNGTGNLLALDKVTGGTIWSKTDQIYEQPVVDNNIVYSASENGLFSFSATNGNSLWQWNKIYWFRGGFPFIADKKVFISGTQNSGFVACFNSTTGSIEWNKENIDVMEYPLVVGNKLFLFRSGLLNSGQSGQSHIMIYDAKTGTAKDSILVSGREFGRPSIITGSGKWINAY